MPTFHHVNLGVPPELAEEEGEFLVSVLGYRRLDPPPAAPGVRWFEADDGTQVHLSLDSEHVPAAKAHTAIDVAGETDGITALLTAAGLPFSVAESQGRTVLNCRDPAGNRWELRA